MKGKKRLAIFILCCSILLVSAGCGKADKQDSSNSSTNNNNNMGNMDHSKMKMDEGAKK